MEEKIKNKLITIVDFILSNENPLCDTREVLLIRKVFEEKGVEWSEVKSAINSLKELGILETDSTILFHSSLGFLDTNLDTETFNNEYNAFEYKTLVIIPNYEKLKKYKLTLLDEVDYKTPVKRKSITKKDGNFYINEKLIEMPARTLHYKIFNILYSHPNQDGYVSYKKIEEYLVKEKEVEILDEKSSIKRINNALQQGLFRTAKIGGEKISNKIHDGIELIETVRGEGLKLNNPTI